MNRSRNNNDWSLQCGREPEKSRSKWKWKEWSAKARENMLRMHKYRAVVNCDIRRKNQYVVSVKTKTNEEQQQRHHDDE